jgi:hypothetical protein
LEYQGCENEYQNCKNCFHNVVVFFVSTIQTIVSEYPLYKQGSLPKLYSNVLGFYLPLTQQEIFALVYAVLIMA